MIRHAIWDFDGTLFDTYPVMTRAFCAALARLDCPDPPAPAEVFARMKQTMDAAFAHCVTGRGLDLNAFLAEYRPLRLRLEREAARPFPAAAELCRDIARAGGENYLFTHRGRSALELLELCGLQGDFADAVTAESGFPRKPVPDGILHLLEKHGIAGAEAIMIGDREMDVLAGRSAGVHTCLLAPAGTPTAAEFLAPDFAALRAALGLGEERA